MGLSNSDKASIEKARAGGNAGLALTLDDAACSYLVGVIASDLGLAGHFDELGELPGFFTSAHEPASLRIEQPFWPLVERLAELEGEAVTYFVCLAKLHKARVKYARILRAQPVPTMEQVGPRGLLQYGAMSPAALTAFLIWRKWVYDIDNRAAQETGYLFEPIIAHAVGGVPVSATASPVRRHDDPRKGRQVDCIRKHHAYEIKLRVTIAASGQGRWREELDFPLDCRKSGYTPVLVVFDATPNPKLEELTRVFVRNKGKAFVGAAAWEHLEAEAGPVMGRFLDRYVREPLDALLHEVPEGSLPSLLLELDESELRISVAGDTVKVRRAPRPELGNGEDTLPDDIDDSVAGP